MCFHCLSARLKRHTQNWRMHQKDSLSARGVKTSRADEHRSNRPFAVCSPYIPHNPLSMKRRVLQCVDSQALRASACAVLAMAALVLGPDHPLAQEPRVSARPDLVAPPAAARTGEGVYLRRAWQRTAQRIPEPFQGLMVPELRRNACQPPAQIHGRLKRQGWWDFHRLRRSGDHFVVRARRPNGTAYELRLDGCSGRVLEANRLNGERQGHRLWPR